MKKSSFTSLMKSMEDGLAITKGKKVKGTLITEYVVHEPKCLSAKEIRKIRMSLDISQPVFAQILGVSVNALRNWEQDRNSPSALACRFLEMIQNDPQSFLGQAEEMQIIEQQKRWA